MAGSKLNWHFQIEELDRMTDWQNERDRLVMECEISEKNKTETDD